MSATTTRCTGIPVGSAKRRCQMRTCWICICLRATIPTLRRRWPLGRSRCLHASWKNALTGVKIRRNVEITASGSTSSRTTSGSISKFTLRRSSRNSGQIREKWR
uniref:(northern house mosquito) hypothetical protein n=1 Tax=Culex pipiens TaxID=7175 RepID=A0A8D7ZT02_CULPI